jgi:hypothetical protein
MKNSLLVLLFFMISSVAVCQLNQGNWLVGGTGKFYSYTNNNSSTVAGFDNTGKLTEIDLSPNIAYFISDKLAVGIKPTFSSLKGKVNSTGGLTTSVSRFMIGPFGRYYLLDQDKPHNILIESSYQLGMYNGSFGLKGNLRAFSVLAGPVLYFNSSVGIEFLLGYSYKLEDVENATKDIKKGFQLGVGMQIHLTK